jgi:cell division septation protein DedD
MRAALLVVLPGVLAAQEGSSAARILFFDIQPRVVKAGQVVELKWAAQGADTVRLEPPGEELPAVGQTTRSPEVSTVFWLSTVNLRGGQSVPVAVEVLPSPPPVPVPETRGPWIQFAALADPAGAQRLQALLQQRLGEPVRVFPMPNPAHPPQTLQRVRLGPFPSRPKAQQRLREIQARIRDLRLKPLVMAD